MMNQNVKGLTSCIWKYGIFFK